MDPFLHHSGPAVYDSELSRWWTYEELRTLVERLAFSLDSQRKALAFCFCRNDLASVAWYLAALESDHAVALLDDGMTAGFKSRLIDLYQPEYILGSSRGCAGSFAVDGYEGIPSVDAESRCWKRIAPPESSIHPELSLLLSTSGSTGSPKFVRLTRANVVSNALSICQGLSIQSWDRAVSSLPLHYSYGLSVLNTHLLAGATVVLTQAGLMSPQFWNVVRDTRCTSFAGVPYSYQILDRLGLESLAVPSVHTMTQAGGKLHNDLIGRFHAAMSRRDGRFFVMYGQTEATARISILPSACLPEKLGSVGLPIPGGSFEIDGGDGKGELIYTGPNVMMGYASSREELAQGDELHGRLRTGDAARLDDDGFLFVAGRTGRDAKILGSRINLDEIENMLRSHGPTAVVSSAGELMIFCEYGDEAAYLGYRQELARNLKLHHRMIHFRRVEQLPLNPSGKVDYSCLAAQS